MLATTKPSVPDPRQVGTHQRGQQYAFDRAGIRDTALTHPQQQVVDANASLAKRLVNAKSQPSNSKRSRTGESIEACQVLKRSEVTSLAPPVSALSCFSKLVELSFEPMAQIDAYTGDMLWCNKSFQDLADTVGVNDRAVGLDRLVHSFVYPRQASTEPIFREASGIQSVTKEDGHVVLWAMHRNRSPELLQPCMQVLDLDAKIPNDCPDTAQGRGTRKTVRLWTRDGTGKRTTETSSGEAVTVERRYFKCRIVGCGARATEDVDVETQRRIKVVGSGQHNHDLILAPTRLFTTSFIS